MGQFVSGLRWTALPPAVRVAALRSVIDVTGVAVAGAAHPVAVAMRGLVAREHAAGPCTLIGTPDSSSATGAALANGVAAHALDFDDTSYAGIAHGTAAVWPAVLAAGEAADAGGADVLAGFVAGCEVEYAIGRAIGDAVYDRGWWTTALFGVPGAAAGAARVLGLDAAATAQAVGLAACATGGLRAVFGTGGKPLLCGRAAQLGLQIALAVAAGVSGPEAGVTGPAGLLPVLAGEAGDPFAELGRRWALVDPGIAFKFHPVCSAAQAAIDAIGQLRAERGFSSEEVAGIDCAVTPLVAQCLVHPEPETPAQAQFSMNFAIAAILHDGDLDLDSLGPERLADPALRATMRKVTMHGSAAMVRTEAQRRDHPEGAVVTVTLRDGAVLTRHVGAALGMPTNPPSLDDLRAKFLGCARRLAPETAALLLARAEGLERAVSVRGLFAAG